MVNKIKEKTIAREDGCSPKKTKKVKGKHSTGMIVAIGVFFVILVGSAFMGK